MKVKDIKKIAERDPFLAFTVRLNDGAEYEFKEPRDFGAPRDYHHIIYFGESDWALIDLSSIAKVIVR